MSKLMENAAKAAEHVKTRSEAWREAAERIVKNGGVCPNPDCERGGWCDYCRFEQVREDAAHT